MGGATYMHTKVGVGALLSVSAFIYERAPMLVELHSCIIG